MPIPNTPGIWRFKPEDCDVDFYVLEQTGDLCFWGPDIGIDGAQDTVWTTDEFVGHVPIHRFHTSVDEWVFVSGFKPLNENGIAH